METRSQKRKRETEIIEITQSLIKIKEPQIRQVSVKLVRLNKDDLAAAASSTENGKRVSFTHYNF